MEAMDETYHSVNGAIAESELVYIGNGFRSLMGLAEISILEIGFGTGLNCLLTALEAERLKILTHYFTIEKFPLPAETLCLLNYPKMTGERGKELFGKIHEAPWGARFPVSPWLYLKKVEADVLYFDWSDIPGFNLVYFDAFAPDKQPEIWDPGLFDQIYSLLSKGGIFVTYCAKGSVRRALVKTGFSVERLPGPKGKREMLRGLKN